MNFNQEAQRIAKQFTCALVSMDLEAVADLYADNVVVWHNTTNQTQTKQQNIDMLRGVFAVERAHTYLDVDCLPTPVGFVQRHTFKPVLKDGTAAGEARVCMVARVANGQITELQEFFDASQVARLWSALGTAKT